MPTENSNGADNEENDGGTEKGEIIKDVMKEAKAAAGVSTTEL